MSEFAFAISWFIISPVALVTDVLAIVVITHYFPFFHGSDVSLISILVAMIGNALFVLPIPAFLEVRSMRWTTNLCYGYVWCVLTFRVAQVLSLMVISVHWSSLLKMSAQKKTYVSTKYLKFSIVFVWISSALFGILPIIGAVDLDFNVNGSCKFLAFNLGLGYALFFLIFNLIAMFVSILCCCDSVILIKNIKQLAGSKYQAGRFQLPDRRQEVQLHAGSSMAEKYHRLQFARDLSKFTMIFVLLAIAINHFPYTVFQVLQLFADVDRRSVEVASLYLVAIEAILLPHALWLLSRRYRHALTYQWKVYVLRNKDIEEDEPTACTLQSYVSRERDRMSLPPSRPLSTIGYSAGGTLRSLKSETMTLPRPPIQMNGQATMSPALEHQGYQGVSSITSPPLNGIIKSEVHVERPPSLYDERPIDIQNLEVPRGIDARGYMSDVGASTSTPMRHEVQRSASSVSRQNWKDHAKRKHLPPIFINEGYEPGDKSPLTEEQIKTIYHKGAPSNISGTSMHYYMSSDYHPDCLTESLPRNKHPPYVPSSESETGDIYRSEDIEEALNSSFVKRNSSRSSDSSLTQRHALRTFKSSPELQRQSRPTTQKGLYSTFEDLSQMEMCGENEIEYDNETIPLDEVEGDIKLVPFQTKTNVKTIKYETSQGNLSSFKPGDSQLRHTLPRHSRSDSSTVMLATTSFGSSSTDTDTIPAMPLLNYKIPEEIQAMANMHRNPPLSRMPGFDFNKQYSYADNSFAYPFVKTENNEIMQQFKESTDVEIKPIHCAQKSDATIDDENASSGSNSSVTLSPYKEGKRHKPWMDDYETQIDEQMGEPLVDDSDTDTTLRDSQDSTGMRIALNSDARYPNNAHSDLSTPVSSIFDEETDRGFEDALEMHINTSGIIYSGGGLCFESIKEEPEDLTSSGSNPFLENTNDDDDEFRTRAVISRSSKSNSRASSCGSVSDVPQSGSPRNSLQANLPAIVTSDADQDFGDSGFTSGLERGNQSETDSSSHQDTGVHAKERSSPWPEETKAKNKSELSFESNFCADSQTRTRSSLPTASANTTNVFSTAPTINTSTNTVYSLNSLSSQSNPFSVDTISTATTSFSSTSKPITNFPFSKYSLPNAQDTDQTTSSQQTTTTSFRPNTSNSSTYTPTKPARNITSSKHPTQNAVSTFQTVALSKFGSPSRVGKISPSPPPTPMKSSPTQEKHTGSKQTAPPLDRQPGSKQTTPTMERRPVHKAVEAIRSTTRPAPVRVRSFEKYSSPQPERRLPQRGHSFEHVRKDVKPAYF